jgi:hypothetical protein
MVVGGCHDVLMTSIQKLNKVSYSVAKLYMKIVYRLLQIFCTWILPPKAGRTAWPRRPLFVTVRSGMRTAQIGWAMVILYKNSIFRKINPRSRGHLSIFCKTTSNYFKINLQSRSDGLRVFCKQDLPFIEN